MSKHFARKTATDGAQLNSTPKKLKGVKVKWFFYMQK